jgi:hypothetical protein
MAAAPRTASQAPLRIVCGGGGGPEGMCLAIETLSQITPQKTGKHGLDLHLRARRPGRHRRASGPCQS